jgi:hypothetical protein
MNITLARKVYGRLSRQRAHYLLAAQMNGTTGYALRAAVGSNLSLVEARIEVQALDGETGERLAVIVAKVGQKEVDELKVEANPSSWSDLLRSMDNLSDAAQRRFADLFIEGSRSKSWDVRAR